VARVIIPYKPRDAFKPYHTNDKRFSITVAHRRAGKTVARINKLIRKAVECERQNPKFSYLAPYYVQAKDIAWLYLKHYAAPILEHGGKVNESELSITLPHNNATIKLYGAENAERMRGLYSDGIVIDEGQGIAASVLTSIILPSLADRNGWLDVSGTPKGWENLLGQLVKLARKDPETWYLQILKASETGIIAKDELDRQRALMPVNEYRQEFECDFDAAITGSIYGEQITKAMDDGRVCKVEYDPKLEVFTSWDLGYDDSTAVIWWQRAFGEVRIIDCYENHGKDMQHYIDIINSRCPVNMNYVPHDAANKLLAAGGRSIYQQMINAKLSVRVIAATSQQNGIEAARKILPNAWFDNGCDKLIEALKNYQFEFDDTLKVYRSKPKHDWSSHYCDAFEIIGQVLREAKKDDKEGKPQFLEAQTINEIFWGKDSPVESRI